MPILDDGSSVIDEIMGFDEHARRFRALERQYGPTLLRQAEIDVLVNLLVDRIIPKSQFLDLVESLLVNRDQERAKAAGNG